ncbi:MAG: long-chain-fatty-acid--CoA ligase [Pseudomonadota bacterium]
MDIGQLLDIARHRFPDKKALVSLGRVYTYEQFHQRVHRLMDALRQSGVRPGDRVAAMMWNRSEILEVYLAAVSLGAMFMPINFRLMRPDLEYVLKDSQPGVVFCEQRFMPVLGEAAAGLDSPSRHMLVVADDPAQGGDSGYERFLASGDQEFRGPVLDGNMPCQLMYTSGTTGRPKGVLLSHENIIWNSLNMLQVRRDRPEDVALVVGPLFHVAALNSHYTTRLALGATAVIMSKFDPQEMMRLVEREKITVLSGTPTMFVMLMEECRAGDFDTSSVTTLTSGADKLPDHIKLSMLKYFPAAQGVFDVFGCTECAPCVTTLTAEESMRKTGCVGRPLPFLQVRLVDEQGRDVSQGEPGEVAVRGPNVMLGYYKQPEATAQVLRDGWLYTGDLAVADRDGALYVVDRKKDIIITGGENVSPREVEEVLYYHPEVVKAAVVGVPDAKWGEKICAAVMLRNGHRVSEEEIRSFCKKSLAGFKVPKKILFVAQLPESGTGKVKKNELRAMLNK